MLNRRDLLVALAVAGGTLATPRLARAAGKIRIGAVASDVSAEPLYAEMQGFDRKFGLDATIQNFSNGGAIIAGVASGALDTGFANLTSIAAARQRGLPIKIVAPATLYTSKAPVTVLVKVRGSKLKTGTDLRGKTIAVSTLRGELQVGVSLWIDKNGGDSSKTQFLELPFSSMAAALTSGRIDAAMITEPAMTLHKDTIELLSDAYTAIADEFLIGGFVASDAWIRDNREDARRFGAAIIETAKWANTHRNETAVFLAKSTGIDEAVIRSMTRATYGERLAVEQIQPVLDAAAKYGSLKETMNAKELLA